MFRNRLFGADGIRSSVDKFPLSSKAINDLARAYADWLWARHSFPSILLGADTRESSHRLKSIFVNSLLRRGVSVVDATIIPTPGLSYLLARKGYFSGGIMISASHNPILENGLKFFDEDGCKLNDQDEFEIEQRFIEDAPTKRVSLKGEYIEEREFVDQYATKIVRECRDWDLERIKLLVDCANGAAYQVVRLTLDMLHIPNALVNANPNGTNINENAGSESVRHSPKRMCDQLKVVGKDFGLALDGDGDRVVIVDKSGTMFDGDMLLAALGFQMHNEGQLRGNSVVTTEAANKGLVNYLHRCQVSTRFVKNGDKYVTQALVSGGLTLGGEQIGHVIIHDVKENVTGDGLRTALFLLRYLARNPGSILRELAPGMHKFPQVKASVHIGRRTELTPQCIPGLFDHLADVRDKVPDLLTLDCRPASTEPMYRVLLEARTTSVESLAAHAFEIGDIIQAYFERGGLPIYVLNCVTGGHIERVSIR